MSRRADRARWTSLTGILVLAAALVVVGLLSREWFIRADLTERNDFTVSTSTKEILAGLDDIVTITVYMSADLPAHMSGFRRRIEDTLSEYRAHGDRNVVVRFVDPSTDADAERDARSYGIVPVQLQTVERDRAQIVSTTIGVTVGYEDRVEVIPLLLVPEQLEYEVSSAILKVTSDELPVVGFVLPGSEPLANGPYSNAAAALAQSREVRAIELTRGADALDGVDALVVAGLDDVADTELYALDQFIMRGGRVLFLLNAVTVPSDGIAGSVASGNIYDYVSRYGAEVLPELVVDFVNESAAFRSGPIAMSVPYPFWPKAVSPNVSREHPVVSELNAIAFPWTSPIERSRSVPESVRFEVLARSSGSSWTVPATTRLDPQTRPEPPPEQAQEINAGRAPGHALIVALTGRFRSAFEGKPVLVPASGGAARSTYPSGRLDESSPTQMIVIGNARMFANEHFAQAPSSPILFLNAVDWLTLGRHLNDVRSKAVDDRPLGEVSEAGKLAARTLGTVAVPLAVVVFGLLRAWSTRRRGRPHEAEAS